MYFTFGHGPPAKRVVIIYIYAYTQKFAFFDKYIVLLCCMRCLIKITEQYKHKHQHILIQQNNYVVLVFGVNESQ